MGIAFTLTRVLLRPLGLVLRSLRAGTSGAVSARLGLPSSDVRQLVVSSTSFRPEGVIPPRFCAAPLGDNVSPQLSWTIPPQATRQLMVVIEDTDVPMSHPMLHVAALIDPGIQTVSEGELNTKKVPPGVRLLSLGHSKGYSGPFPMPGHGQHRYDHHVIALDEAIPDDVGSADDAIKRAVGHVLAHGVLVGTHRT